MNQGLATRYLGLELAHPVIASASPLTATFDGMRRLEDARAAVRDSLADAAREGATDFETIRRHARRSLGRFIDERTRRRPIVIPVVIEV